MFRGACWQYLDISEAGAVSSACCGKDEWSMSAYSLLWSDVRDTTHKKSSVRTWCCKSGGKDIAITPYVAENF